MDIHTSQLNNGSTDDDRLTQLATIFAAAILRLHHRAALENSPDSDADSLEIPPEIRLSVSHNG